MAFCCPFVLQAYGAWWRIEIVWSNCTVQIFWVLTDYTVPAIVCRVWMQFWNFFIEREKSYDYLLITYMKKCNGRSLTGSKGSCLLCRMFGNSLENLGKSTGECKNKQSDKFPKFLKIFRNLRKSSEIFGKNRKMSQNAEDDLPAF